MTALLEARGVKKVFGEGARGDGGGRGIRADRAGVAADGLEDGEGDCYVGFGGGVKGRQPAWVVGSGREGL
ncbi:hypothetical protein CBW65_14950 [Tumebacillus avium]|uniref:Uncharacterized protein n=1 Tax=Tumebacillus avium TaxID=1903704 RepID=A0A1Y0IS28_9BACL|nr:hypothetical protein CBW65_14950 [Tumebacillus avium]